MKDLNLSELQKTTESSTEDTMTSGVSSDQSDDSDFVVKNVDTQHEIKGDKDDTKKVNEKEIVLIQDTGFNIKINAPGTDSFELPVSSIELVQEIHQVLMDREDTCHRTCFSLQLHGVTLDKFAELKTIERLKDGISLDVIEEPYTVREARIHVRHIRDLLKSADHLDAYNGNDCLSPSFLNTVTVGDILEKKRTKPDSVDCTPPEYIMPASKERPLLALHPGVCDNLTPPCVKVMTYSGWNPPPGYRRMHGDLLYLYVVTLEERRFHITASNHGFYINQSKDEEFNPKPAQQKYLSHSLINLLNQISAAFKRNFSVLLKRRSQKHPFERVPTPYQLYSWMAPPMEHNIDFIRTEDGFATRLGYEEHIPGQMRDWNEELQTTRELSKSTLPERLIRERAIFKVHSDFVSAATRGAVAVVDGHIMSINPGEEFKMQMFIWNNIFFSLGFDVRDHYKDLGGDAAAYTAPANDLQGVRAYFSTDPDKLYVLGTAIIDYRGYRVTGQCIIPGILEREQEQSVVYGSVDFGKTVVSSDRYCELLLKTATQLKISPHHVVNDKGEEVEIFSSVECKGIIGNDQRCYILDLLRTFPPDTNYLRVAEDELSGEMRKKGFPRDHRHKLCCLRQELIEAFVEYRYVSFVKHSAFQLQQLQLKHHLDCLSTKKADSDVNQNGINSKLELTANDKSAADNSPPQSISTEPHTASMNGHLHNGGVDTPTDSGAVEVGDENTAIKGETAKVAEQWLSSAGTDDGKVEVHVRSEESKKEAEKLLESLKSSTSQCFESFSKDIVEKAARAVGSLSDNEFDISFNPDVFQAHVIHANPTSERFQREKQLVVSAAEYLVQHQIPFFVSDCLEHTTTPADGATLCESLHNRGINLRYLGDVVAAVASFPQLSYLHAIGVTELLCRTAKHLYKGYIQNVDLTNLSSAVSHFLNCLLGSCTGPMSPVISEETKSKKRVRKKNKGTFSAHSDNLEWKNETPKLLWKKMAIEMNEYFKFSLDGESIEALIETYSIQKVSLLRSFCICVGIQLRLGDYQLHNKHRHPFSDEDIVNLFPRVKHIQPKASDAYHFFSSGQAKIQQGLLREGCELITEAVNLLNNVYGAMHTDICVYSRLLARLNYILSDHAEALCQQQRAVIMSERVFGIDHPNTINDYAQLALYCFANKQVSSSLHLLYRARYLALLCHGEHHPNIALFDSNIGLILHAVEEYDLSLKFLGNALSLNIKFYGEKSLKVAMSHHLMARTHSCRADFRAALASEKDAYAIYKQQLGEGHERTNESSECLRHLTQQAVVFQRKMNEICKGEKGATMPPLMIQAPSLSNVLDTLNIINGIVFIQISKDDIDRFKRQLGERSIQLESQQDDEGRGETETSTAPCVGDIGTHGTSNETMTTMTTLTESYKCPNAKNVLDNTPTHIQDKAPQIENTSTGSHIDSRCARVKTENKGQNVDKVEVTSR